MSSPTMRSMSRAWDSIRNGPPIFTSLAAKALKFDYLVHGVMLDTSFAKVRVWEKGYFYATATESSYELASSTLFILEKNEISGE